MNNKPILKGLVLAAAMGTVLVFCGLSCFAEQITITTYYPAPFGVYKELKLQPNISPSTCDANNEGAMYYDNTANEVMVCREIAIFTYNWESIGGWWTSNDGTNIFNTNTDNVGIGTANPQAMLDVSSITSAFLPPRMTTAQRDAISPSVEGMMVYNNDEQRMEYYNSSAWLPVGAGAINVDSGSYTGDNTYGKKILTQLDGKPRFVIVAKTDGGKPAWFCTNTMVSPRSRKFGDDAGNSSIIELGVESGKGYFKVGTAEGVNKNGKGYTYIAIY